MDKQLQTLQHNLETAIQRADAKGIEFWFARDLQAPLGYARWENFQTAIKRAIESCQATGQKVADHFRGITKMVELGSGSMREIDDFLLTHRKATRPNSRDPHDRKPTKKTRRCPLENCHLSFFYRRPGRSPNPKNRITQNP